jgi:hypothetical protein
MPLCGHWFFLFLNKLLSQKKGLYYSKRRATGRGRPWSDLFVDVERRHLWRALAHFSAHFLF